MAATAHPIDATELSRRLTVANRVLELLRAGYSVPVWLKFKGRRAFVCWEYHGNNCVQWVTRGNDFYPTWHGRRGPWGGTTSTAMSQLIYWCQGKAVLPLSSWQYWCGPTVLLGREKGDEIVTTLQDGGYPVAVTCVVCGKPPVGMDWWSLNGVSGPCCRHADGCRSG